MDKSGKFIGVGSVKHGQGITSLVYNLGYNLKKNTDLSILIFDMNFLFGEMDFLIDHKTNNSIDDLISIAKNQELTKELLLENTEVLSSNLRVVNPSRISSSDYLKKNAEYVLSIIQAARSNFDIVIVDTVAGTQSPVSRLVSSNCDVFINVMTQNPYILEWYKAYNNQTEVKEINVINMFEEDIYPDYSAIKRDFGIDHIVLNYSKQMRDYYNQKKIEAFVAIKDPYNTCMHQLIKSIFALTGMDIKLRNEESDGNKKGFLQSLFKKD